MFPATSRHAVVPKGSQVREPPKSELPSAFALLETLEVLGRDPGMGVATIRYSPGRALVESVICPCNPDKLIPGVGFKGDVRAKR